MSIMRKVSCFIMAAIIFMIFMAGSNQIYSDNIYPLEAGEKLIEEAMVDQNHAEIFTQLNEDFYLKKLQRNEDQWVLESTELLYPKWTGLEINKIDKGGDRKLALALESKLKSYGVEPASLPQAVDYSQSEFLPPVGMQYENSCVGWSTGYYLRTYQQAKDIGWEVKNLGNGVDSHIFSPTFIYNQIHKGGEGVDGGASFEDAAGLLMNVGAASLEVFPYVAGDFYTKPDQAAIQSAYPHRIREWRLLYSDIDTDQYIIQKAKEYLNTGDLLAAGSRIGFKFQYPYVDQNGNSVITMEYYPSAMHAYIIVGYDDNFISPDGIGAFKLVNSWGKEWGNGGFSYISYQAFAANALQGFVFTDLANAEPRELTTDINDNVIFSMDFSGTGRFDFKIKDANDQLVYEENNLQGQQGLSSLAWSGKDMAGNNVADGSYNLSIIPYRGDTPKPAFNSTFNKLGKVESAGAKAYSYENIIQYVDIPITFKSDGMVNIKVAYNGAIYDLISNKAVKSGESNVYKILKSDFDFNNIDLNQVKIVIDIQ